MRYFVFIVFVFHSLVVVAQTDDRYLSQLGAIERMLEGGRHAKARAQARALAELAADAQLTELEARATYLLARGFLEDPVGSSEYRVKAIEAIQRSASAFGRAGKTEAVDSLRAVITRLGEGSKVDRLPGIKEEVRPLGDTTAVDLAMTTIIDIQNRKIEELSESQLRQLAQIQLQNQELERYEIKVLNDSIQILQTEQQLVGERAENERERQRRNFFIVLALGALVAAGLIYSRFRSSQRYRRRLQEQYELLEQERRRSEELLLNILPAEVAQELKEGGKASTRTYNAVSVIFVDFIGFSRLSTQRTPEELISILDTAFRAFDEIVGRHGVEKIKTIGDAYMCACGVPVPREDHAQRAVDAALEMQEFLEDNSVFDARIGIHAGPVIAGVVGKNKFVYDIWGDTVNQAARLESAGNKGEVTVSSTVVELLGNEYDFERLGTFEAKNIGLMDRYVVRSRANLLTKNPS